MATTSRPLKPWDPDHDAVLAFSNAKRLRIARACRQRPHRLDELGRVSRQSKQNGRTMGATMVKRDMLKTVSLDDGGEGLVLMPRWAQALDRFTSAPGLLMDDQRLILVRDTGRPAAFRLLSVDAAPPEAAWATTLAGAGWEFAIALRPGVRDEHARRFLNRLREAGVDCDLVRTGTPIAGQEMQAWAAGMLPDAG